MTLGKVFYKCFFEPTFPIRYNLTHFGLKGWYNYALGENMMKKTALNFPEIKLADNPTPAFSVNFLTGVNYWHQTLFCIQSLINQYGLNLSIQIYSDGTISKKIHDIFKNYCPQITVFSEEQIIEVISKIIPSGKYPSLNFLRNWHPFFKRIIDIHCNAGWNLHLDSDMLFLKYPSDLINFSTNRIAVFMEEQMDYSYFVDDSKVLLQKYNIATLPKVNGGIIGYDGNLLDYDDLENKSKILLENYFDKGPAKIEQTLMSYILCKQNAVPLNKSEYKIYYDQKIGSENETLRHYIFKAKLPYLQTEWKKVVH